jgi:steroid delta-isomerase-like uncharacterized protein
MGKARDVVEASYRALNAGDLDGVMRDVDDTAIAWFSGQSAELRGKDQIRELIQGGLNAFPGYQMKITNIVESGDWVVVESRFTGTHAGPLVIPGGSIPATGKTVEAPTVDVFEVRGGKIVTRRGYFDNLDVMTQLGLVPTGAATTS